MIQILIAVEDGMVQDILSTDPNVSISVIDGDCIGVSESKIADREDIKNLIGSDVYHSVGFDTTISEVNLFEEINNSSIQEASKN